MKARIDPATEKQVQHRRGCSGGQGHRRVGATSSAAPAAGPVRGAPFRAVLTAGGEHVLAPVGKMTAVW